MEIRLLGPVQVRAAGRTMNVGPPQRRAVLAALSVDAGRLVRVATLIDRVWDDHPPQRVEASVHAHVSGLRRLLAQVGVAEPALPTPGLARRGDGYLLQVDPAWVDLHRFRRLVVNAVPRDCADGDRARLLREALDLSLGPALADLPGGWADRMRRSWAEERVDAAAEWAEAAVRLGLHNEVIARVRPMLAEYPVAERLAAALLRALAATDRTAEALEHYAHIRGRLADELGVRPGRQLRSVHQDVLRADTPTIGSGGGVTPTTVRAAVRVAPAQLPADVPAFTGRIRELSELDTLLAGSGSGGPGPTAVVVSAVSGTAGVGKTALTVHWAHRVADRFPDGQLYVNLRGFDPGGQVMDPAAALRGFLDALGVPGDRVPAGLDAQAALYRSVLAGQRVLVVLDNARDAEHARPLLPGAGTALAVVTSRSQLTGLVAADGAHPLTLDLLSTVEARELLARRLGADRASAEPDAVDRVVVACARLPLALAVAAARAQQSTFPLAALAAELTDAGRRLDTLDAGDSATQVQAVFSWSYTALTPPAARLFRLLGLHPGPDVAAPAAASLAGQPLPETRRQLAELTRATLSTQHSPGRYGLHDLLAVYAAGLTRTHDTPADRRAATIRLLDHYTHTAHTAARLLYPAREPEGPALTPPAPGAVPEQPDNHRQALAWLNAEHPALLAALRLAADSEHDTHACQLAWALQTFLYRRGNWPDLARGWQAALTAAGRLGSPTTRAYAHRLFAEALTRLGRHGEAHSHFERALDLFGRVGDRSGQAYTHNGLSVLSEAQGRPEQALGHAQHVLTLHRAAGNHRGQAHGHNSVGWCHALLGDYPQALTHCQQALVLFQQTGDRQGEAHTWDSLGYAHHHLAHHTHAADCYHHALTLFRDLGDRHLEATVLTHLGDTHQAAGDPDAARTTWTHALTVLTNLDHPDADNVRVKLHNLPHQPPRP